MDQITEANDSNDMWFPISSILPLYTYRRPIEKDDEDEEDDVLDGNWDPSDDEEDSEDECDDEELEDDEVECGDEEEDGEEDDEDNEEISIDGNEDEDGKDYYDPDSNDQQVYDYMGIIRIEQTPTFMIVLKDEQYEWNFLECYKYCPQFILEILTKEICWDGHVLPLVPHKTLDSYRKREEFPHGKERP